MSPDAGSSAACIVCERGTWWTSHLRRFLRHAAVTIEGCRDTYHGWTALERFPSSIVLVEVNETQLERVLDFLVHVQSRFTSARTVVMPPRSCAQAWWLREAGAIHIAESTRELETVACLVQRHVRQAPARPFTWTEQVHASLPWPR
jgi:hypothetical protein